MASTGFANRSLGLQAQWLFRMAWRDSRKNLSRLFLFISSIVLGIAALVSIFSLDENARKDIDLQAKTLIGADLSLESGQAPSPQIQKTLDSISPPGNARSEERSFASMIYFPKSQGSRLVQVRALHGDYPYYGALETNPSQAARHFQGGRQALVDQTLMLQYGAQVGDSIRIGSQLFQIAGALLKSPGRNGFSTTIAPPVFIPLEYLEQTGLDKKGSRIQYSYYYRLPTSLGLETWADSARTRLEHQGWRLETVASRKKLTSRIFEDFNRFLTLVSFIALLLGCIGVASSIHIYIREKIHSIAVLRCLGASGSQAFLIYLIQVLAFGALGSMAGAALGVGLLHAMPSVLKDFLPFELSTRFSGLAVVKGVGLGVSIAFLFALLPLLAIRKVEALTVLRYPVVTKRGKPGPWTWVVYLLIFGFVVWFAGMQMQSYKQGLIFTLAIVVALGMLAAVAATLRWAVRRFFPSSWNYLWRQGLSNLYRPNNQTLVLLVTIGLGTGFIANLYFVQSLLVGRLQLTAKGNQPNMVVFDIQTSQNQALADLARSRHLKVLMQIPVVSVRLDQVNGKPPDELFSQDTGRREGPGRRMESDLRVSFRDSLISGEKITEGKWQGRVEPGTAEVPISLEENFAKRMHLHLGDRLQFNVQGVSLAAKVGSVRETDNQRMQTNFGIIFPAGALESAPQFHVMMLRVPDPAASAAFQKAVVQQFPNVSLIDLGLVLQIVETLLDKVGFVIRFMAGFSILTGFIVLIASVLISRFQRMQEMVLLRTLGASQRQITSITLIEYALLGILAAATGVLLALLGTWALAYYSFDMVFIPNFVAVFVIFASVTTLVVLVGWFNSRDLVRKSPLEVLRRES